MRLVRSLALLLLPAGFTLSCTASPPAPPAAAHTPAPPPVAQPRLAAVTPEPSHAAESPPPAPPVVSAPVAPPPKVPTLADDVETEGASAGGRRLPLGTGENSGPGERFVFLVPKGWTEERLVTDGTVWQGLAHPRHPKGDAKVVINSFSWRPEQPTLDAWTKFLRVADAAWEAPHDGKLGALPARIAAGKGKLGGEDADLVYALISQRGGYILAIGALKNGATPERRQELVDCLRGLALR